MSGVMTPLELMENNACLAIAQAVSSEHSPAVPGSHEAMGLAAAKEIERRIFERQLNRTLAPDPFVHCLFPGCGTEALGAFCPTHVIYLPLPVRRALSDAIVEGDHEAYGRAVGKAREEIYEALAAAAHA